MNNQIMPVIIAIVLVLIGIFGLNYVGMINGHSNKNTFIDRLKSKNLKRAIKREVEQIRAEHVKPVFDLAQRVMCHNKTHTTPSDFYLLGFDLARQKWVMVAVSLESGLYKYSGCVVYENATVLNRHFSKDIQKWHLADDSTIKTFNEAIPDNRPYPYEHRVR